MFFRVTCADIMQYSVLLIIICLYVNIVIFVQLVAEMCILLIYICVCVCVCVYIYIYI